jgi:hypothetical protein
VFQEGKGLPDSCTFVRQGSVVPALHPAGLAELVEAPAKRERLAIAPITDKSFRVFMILDLSILRF